MLSVLLYVGLSRRLRYFIRFMHYFTLFRFFTFTFSKFFGVHCCTTTITVTDRKQNVNAKETQPDTTLEDKAAVFVLWCLNKKEIMSKYIIIN